jgi:hypothetical protein
MTTRWPKIAAGNAGWRSQFRFVVHANWSRVPELWTLAACKPCDDSGAVLSNLA